MMTRNIEDNVDDVLKMTTVTMLTMRCSSDQFVNNFLLGFFFTLLRYDPTTRPWYYAAKSYPGKVTFSVPYLVSSKPL